MFRSPPVSFIHLTAPQNRAATSALQTSLYKQRRAANGSKKTKDEEGGSPPTPVKSVGPPQRPPSVDSVESVSMHAPPYGQREVRISVPRQEAQPQPPPTTHILMPGQPTTYRDFRLRLTQQQQQPHPPHPFAVQGEQQVQVQVPVPMHVDEPPPAPLPPPHANGVPPPEDLMGLFLRACNLPQLRPVLYDAGLRDGEQLRTLAADPGLVDDFFNSLREERRVDLFQVTVMKRRLREWRDAR